MKVGGSYTLPLLRQRAHELLQDPAILARCMPGCEDLKKIGPDEYEMQMKVVVSAVQGLFAGKVRITDQKPPESFRLIVEGSGKVGFMKGDGLLTLVPATVTTGVSILGSEGTEVRYEGDVQVGGTLAGVGQRLLDSTAKMIIRKFFEKLAEAGAETEQAAIVP
ncbi:MAG: carbon monoxide dehydrogenase [Acidobacteria bacterium]|nr:MAG: carbon monoxide dehydrogenase [Acidobacteriota bacterium]